MKRVTILCSVLTIFLSVMSCQTGDLSINPNAASTVPVSLLLNRIENEIYNGGGVLNNYPGAASEGPWNQLSKWNQYIVANYSYYWGSNFYTWSNSSTHYNMLKYIVLMENGIATQFKTPTIYTALTKFFRAYAFIWYTQRVGDIPMTQAGSTTNLAPAFDLQHDVYKNALALLDTANTLITPFATATPTAQLSTTEDVFALNYLQWQKLINTYKLRVLISLSKRAIDNPDLNIPTQFATIVNNPAQYPIMTGNGDNMVFKYSSLYTPYPIKSGGYGPYNVYSNIGAVFMNQLASTSDPRTFIFATPAFGQVPPNANPLTKLVAPLSNGSKAINDFTAYVGSDINISQSTLLVNATNGMYSYANYNRYYNTADGTTCEPYIIVGYPEMCFNIAEASNLGWGGLVDDGSWYSKGVNAALTWVGATQNASVNVADWTGVTYGNVTLDVNTFLTNITYAGANTPAGRQQILWQKYVGMFMNSGWEPYYNWRRTGIPALASGGSGIGTPANAIPFRWLYPNNEIISNSSNYSAAVASQYGGTETVYQTMWLTK